MKRSPIKRKARLRPMSAKRKKQLPDRVRVGVQIPATCELCPLVYDVDSYREFAGRAAEWQFRVVDPHHVFSRRLDAPCNVVAACRVCHEWSHECWQRAGRVVATEVLCRAGRFDRERIRAAWGRDPIAAIEVDWATGMFASDPVISDMATVVLGRF